MPRLTDIKIRNTRATEQDVLLSDGGCLFLRVRPSGSRGWIVRIKRQGKRRVHSLGAWPTVSIKAARAKAASIVAVDLAADRVTVAAAVEDFMNRRVRPHAKHVANPEVYARAITMSLGTLAVDMVRPVDVSRMVTDYQRRAPVAAMQLLAFAKRVFAWTISMGYRERSPVADLQASAFGVVQKSRERVLTDAELRQFWRADDLPHRPLLRFLLLSGLRLREAQRAQRRDIDAEHWLTIPAKHSKNGKAHRLFLPPLALKQLEPDAVPLLFKGVTPTSVQVGLRRWQTRHHVTERWTAHDLRRSFATRCGSLGIAPHIISKLLNHALTGASDALPVYLRSEWLDERKQAADLLAQHIAAVVR